MVYRGRLIFPFICEIAQLDLAGTEAAGFDPEFKEPKIESTPSGIGQSTRAETIIKVPASLHMPQTSLSLQQSPTGNLNRVDMLLAFHFADLEALNLVEAATGTPLIKVGDRLNAIFEKDGTTLVQAFANPPGAFVTEASSQFGLNSGRNLLLVRVQSRDQGSNVGG